MNRTSELLRLVAANRAEVAGSILASAAGVVLSWWIARFTEFILDSSRELASRSSLAPFVAAVCAALVVRAAILVLRAWLKTRIAQSIGERLAIRYVRHVLHLPVHTLEDAEQGSLDFVARFDGYRDVRAALVDVLLAVCVDALLAVGTLCLLLIRHPRVGVIFVALVPLLPAVAALLRLRSRHHRERAYRAGCERARAFVDALMHPKTTRGFNAERWALERIERPFREEQAAEARADVIEGTTASVLDLAGGLILVFALARGASLLAAGEMTPGQLAFCIGLLGAVIAPARSLAGVAPGVQRALVALDGLADVLAKPRDDAAPLERPKVRGAIDVRDLSFEYTPGVSALKGVAFSVKPGSVTAVVGESGCGKSTLLALLLGLYRPTSGEIRVDGRSLSDLDVAAFRDQVGAVFQRTWLYRAKIHENVTLGRAGIGGEAVLRALRLARADAFAARFSGCADLGHDGAGLSGGEVQRLGIARALAGAPRLLLLDEATSNLDGVTEAAILDAIEGLAGETTCIIVAHRLSTVVRADQILVMEAGTIVERGTHDELMRGGGHYHSLFQRQTSGWLPS